MPRCQPPSKVPLSREAEEYAESASGGETNGMRNSFNLVLQQSFRLISETHRLELDLISQHVQRVSVESPFKLLQLDEDKQPMRLPEGTESWLKPPVVPSLIGTEPTASTEADDSCGRDGVVADVQARALSSTQVAESACGDLLGIHDQVSGKGMEQQASSVRNDQRSSTSVVQQASSVSNEQRHAKFAEAPAPSSLSNIKSDRGDVLSQDSMFSVDDFNLLPLWRQQSASQKHKKQLWMKMARTISHDDINALSEDKAETVAGACSRQFVSLPSSTLRFLWDLLGSLLVFYDVVTIPLGVFDLHDNRFLIIANYCTLCFWTMDLATSFFVGYLSDGVIILDLGLIAKRYLKSWFAVDFCVLIIDWSSAIADRLGEENDFSSYGTFLRILRVVRAVRLIRFLKLGRIFERLRELIRTEYLSMALDVARLTIVICVFSHVIACIFYYLGDTAREDGMLNWIDALPVSQSSRDVYLYFTCFHWALTQFTPASVDVQPHNLSERAYAVFVLIMGLLVFSAMLSEITSSLLQLRRMSEEDNKQFWMLRRFLVDRGVPRLLGTRIRQYLQHRKTMSGRHVREESISILQLLSDQLHKELQYNIKVKHIAQHTLFAFIIDVTNATMLRLTRSMNFTNLACADTLFFQNEISECMYFVVSGKMYYFQDRTFGTPTGHRSAAQVNRQDVTNKDFLCEPALWTTWVHVGDLHAMTECCLIAVDVNQFGSVIQTNPAVYALVTVYAEAFLQILRERKTHVLTDLCYGYDYRRLKQIMNVYVNGQESNARGSQQSARSSIEGIEIAGTRTAAHIRQIIASLQGLLNKGRGSEEPAD